MATQKSNIHPLIAKIFESHSIPISELSPPSSSQGILKHVPQSSLSSSSSSSSSSPSKSKERYYFTKAQRDVPQMRGEIEGLRAMGLTSPSLVPRVLGFEVSDDQKQSAMVTQYFKLGSAPNNKEIQIELGKKLAEMHRTPPPRLDASGNTSDDDDEGGYTGKYGLAVPTHCGVTEQDNTWTADWETFFRERRLGDMVRRIGDREISRAWEELKTRAVPLLLHSFTPAPQPVIQHGDLWSGNKGYDTLTGRAVVFDPASYYGHNEADLGITHMFGGFSQDFYEAYHAIHPKSQPHYDQRQKLYELYHHLNHTLMFGGSYKSGALGIMRSLTQWAESQSESNSD
ncbi:fructosamine kinase [Kwoniella heveanensis CBS 569]|nr:fructosamine kinase [Kwoniella heveanensis CBS 569]